MAEFTTPAKLIKRPRKPHECYWCGEQIHGEHLAWSTFGDGGSVKTRCHVECDAAWQRGLRGNDAAYFEEGLEFVEMSRGCLCSRGECSCGKGGE